MRALVADDNLQNRRFLTMVLEDEGFTVVQADEEIYGAAESARPDIIILDGSADRAGGAILCERLRNSPFLQNVPIIVLSDSFGETDFRKVLEAGAYDLIRVRTDPAEVIPRVRSAYRYKQLQDELAEMTIRDGLTGLYNYSMTIELLEKALARQKRAAENIAFVLADIDRFRELNASYGYGSGDIALKRLSQILSNSIRESDSLGRYGGEEFGLLLYGISREGAGELCERIRKSVADERFGFGDDSVQLTVSIGAVWKPHASEAAGGAPEVIARAEEALSRSKKAGRNRLTIEEL